MRANRSTTELVKKQLAWINERLSSKISQAEKSIYCTVIEKLLHDSGLYQGWNNLYWIKQGHKEWKEAGEPNFPVKNKYITGCFATQDGTCEDTHMGDITGEFSRVYFG